MRFLCLLALALSACAGSVDGSDSLQRYLNAANANGDGDDTAATDDQPVTDPDPPPPDTNPCTNGKAVFCDDFEDHALGSVPGAPWTAVTREGAVVVDSARAYSGKQAMKSTTNPYVTGSSYRQALLKINEADAPITGNAYFGRMMVWYSALLPSDSTNGNFHWSIVRSDGPVTTEQFNGKPFTATYAYGGQYGHVLGNYNSGNGPASDCWEHATNEVIPAQTWTCVEWQYDGPNDAMRFWVNGRAIDAATVVGKGQGCIKHDLQDRWVAPDFATTSVGWENYQALPDGYLFYWDDVAFGPEQLGCPVKAD